MSDTITPDPTSTPDNAPGWLQNFANSFQSPGMMALLGAAKGFGQAAMPSPYKIPLGAVLAQGVGGMADGVHQAFANQAASQQTQMGQLSLDQQKAMQPYVLAQRKALMQSMAGGMPGGGGQSGSAQALIPPQLAAQFAMMAASDPSGKSSRSVGPWLEYLSRYANQPGVVAADGSVMTPNGSNQAVAGRTVAETLAGVPAKIAAAGGEAQAQNPALIARAGGVANAELPAQLARQGWQMTGGGLQAVPGGPNDPAIIGQQEFERRQAAVQPTLQINAGETRNQVLGRNNVMPADPNQVQANPFPQWAQQINGAENGTGNPAAPNASGPGGTPTSSAVGNGQFLTGTWPTVIRAARPDLAAGRTDAQLQSLRANPQLAQEATEQYARMNAQALGQAGLPVNGATVAMAHGLGADGAMKVLRAGPNVPLAMILPKPVLDANPQLQGKTAGDVGAMYQQRMTSRPQTQQLAPGISSVQASPGSPTVITNTREPQLAAMHADDEEVSQLMGHSQQAQNSQAAILNLRNAGSEIATGAGAPQRAELSNWISTYLGPKFAKQVTGIDAGNAQELVKQTLTAAGGAERETLGARGGIGAITMYRNAFPGLETQPTAFRDMTNLLAVSQQRTIDEAQTVGDAHIASRDRFMTNNGEYTTNPTTQAEFNKTHPPQLYVGAAAALNGKPYQQWSKGLTPAQQQEALRTAWRTDPSAQIVGMDGKTLYTNPALQQQAAQ